MAHSMWIRIWVATKRALSSLAACEFRNCLDLSLASPASRLPPETPALEQNAQCDAQYRRIS